MPRLTDRPQPPPGPPVLPPSPRPKLPPAPPTLQQRAWASLMLAMLSLFALMMIGNIQRAIYVVAVALTIAVTAVALAISAMSAARKAGTRRPGGALPGTLLGLVGFSFSCLWIAAAVLLWTPLNQYATCMDGAGTVALQQACQQQFLNSVNTDIAVLNGK